MNIAKTLGPAAWKALCNEHEVADGDRLATALAALAKLPDDAFADAEKAVEKIAAAAQALLKDKDVAAKVPVLRHLKAMLADAQAAEAELQQQRAGADEDEESAGTLEARVRSALSKLKSSAVPFRLIVCESKPVDLVVITKANITPALRDQMTGVTQSKKFSKVGTVTREGNLLRIDLPGASGGMAGRIQRALFRLVAQRFKVVLGEDVADEQLAAEPDAPAATRAGGVPPAAKTPPTEKPAKALAGKPSRPAVPLSKAPLLWQGASDLIGKRIALLKTAVRQHYGDKGAGVLAEIDRNLVKLDAVADRFDDRLVKALAQVNAAAPTQRDAELKKARALAAEYVRYIKDEPLVDHMDRNPFGVPTQIEKLVTGCLAQLDQALV